MTLPYRVLAVIDRPTVGSDARWLSVVASLAAVRGLWLQLRVKIADAGDRAHLLREAANRLGAARSRTLVNGTLAEAAELGLAGAHYPEAAMPASLTPHAPLLAGASVHTPAARRSADEAGFDYVIAGPLFAPASKPGSGRGMAWLAHMRAAGRAPLLAIGGITPALITDCLAAGADGVAVLGGIVSAADPAAAARAYLAAATPPGVRRADGAGPA